MQDEGWCNMYTLLVNDNNEIITTVKERIMQRSKLVDNLHILANPIYKGHDMSDFTLMMEYVLPVSREYHSEILVKSDELYKDKLEYKLPFDTNLTKEAGKIEIQLTFVKVSLDADGKSKQQVRKTTPAVITITPISAWSDIVADSALTAIDQRLIQTEALIKAASELNGGSCSGVYIPSYTDDGIITFTLKEDAEEPSYSFDINPLNDWNPIDNIDEDSIYTWEEL
jgi:hypothetical protein